MTLWPVAFSFKTVSNGLIECIENIWCPLPVCIRTKGADEGISINSNLCVGWASYLAGRFAFEKFSANWNRSRFFCYSGVGKRYCVSYYISESWFDILLRESSPFHHPSTVVCICWLDSTTPSMTSATLITWSEKIPVAPFYHWIPETRNLRRFLVSGIQW